MGKPSLQDPGAAVRWGSRKLEFPAPQRAKGRATQPSDRHSKLHAKNLERKGEGKQKKEKQPFLKSHHKI